MQNKFAPAIIWFAHRGLANARSGSNAQIKLSRMVAVYWGIPLILAVRWRAPVGLRVRWHDGRYCLLSAIPAGNYGPAFSTVETKPALAGVRVALER